MGTFIFILISIGLLGYFLSNSSSELKTIFSKLLSFLRENSIENNADDYLENRESNPVIKREKKNKFLKENKTFFAIIIAAVIIGGFIYLSLNKTPLQDSQNKNIAADSQTPIRFYIKSAVANIRECPSIDCKILVRYFQNSWWDFPLADWHYNSVNDMPEWVPIRWSDEKGNSGNGYINKSNFSDTPTVVNPNQNQQQNYSENQKQNNISDVNNTSKVFDFWGKSVAAVSCFNSSVKDSSAGGSGTLFKNLNGGYIVLTNQHVVSGNDLCFVSFLPDPTGTNGFDAFTYQGVFSGKLSTNPDDDEYILKPEIVEQKWRTITVNEPLSLDFIERNAIIRHICDRNSAKIGDDIAILGYPAIGSKYGLTLTSGKISGYEGNYYVTDAKIDHGNSGGAAILVKNNCYLGIPTFGIVGQIESLGRILDISRFGVY